MPELPIVNPDQGGWVPTYLQRVYALLERWIETDVIPAAGICVGRGPGMVRPRFFGMMLGGGTLDGEHVLSPATVRAMTANQLRAMPRVPREDRRCRPWGLG